MPVCHRCNATDACEEHAPPSSATQVLRKRFSQMLSSPPHTRAGGGGHRCDSRHTHTHTHTHCEREGSESHLARRVLALSDSIDYSLCCGCTLCCFAHLHLPPTCTSCSNRSVPPLASFESSDHHRGGQRRLSTTPLADERVGQHHVPFAHPTDSPGHQRYARCKQNHRGGVLCVAGDV